jgi:hypothetical protein
VFLFGGKRMASLVVNAVAKTGVVKGAKRVKKPTKKYQQLIKDANARIIEDQKNCAITYQKAASYLAKY